MSLLSPVPREQLGTKYTHYGWFAGLAPVYLGALDTECPEVEARNWVPELWFDVVEAGFGLVCTACSFINPAFEPSFPIVITGHIEQ
jgi:hypothetical protein